MVDRKEPSTVSYCSELSKTVPVVTKEKIWSNKYVDLVTLLTPVTQKKVGLAMDEEEGGLVSYSQPVKRITSFAQWAKAFRIFTDVYLEKPGNQHEQKAMSAYVANIECIWEKGGDWIGYDYYVRTQRQGEGQPEPWMPIMVISTVWR